MSSPTTDVSRALCMLKLMTFLRTTKPATTIHVAAVMAAAIMMGLKGMAIRMKSAPGAVEKNRGRASCQYPVLPWKSLVPTRNSVADHTKTEKSVMIKLNIVPEIVWSGERLCAESPVNMLYPRP